MRKRAKGHGYEVSVRVGGRRVWRTFADREAADEWVRTARSRDARGQVGLPVTATVGELWDWFKRTRLPDLAPKSRVTYEYLYQRIEPLAGRHLTHQDVLEWRATLTGAWHSRNQVFGLLRALYNAGMQARLVSANPCHGVRWGKPVTVRPKRMLTADDIAKLWTACTTPRQSAMLIVALNTGMRIGELVAMQWSWLSPGWQMVTVPAAAAKSRISRSIPMLDAAVVALKAWRSLTERVPMHVLVGARRPNTQKYSDVVFPCSVVRAQVDAIGMAQRSGVAFHWHLARHTYCSTLLQAGVDANKVRQLMGHATMKLTMETYNHVHPDADRAVRLLVGGGIAVGRVPGEESDSEPSGSP